MTDFMRKVMVKVDVTSVRAVTYAAVFTFLTAIFTIIAFSTPNWLVADDKQPVKRFERLGLWEACFHTFRDPNYLYDREFRGCKWLFDEDYAFLLDFLEPLTAICSISTIIAFVTPNWLASDRRLYGAHFVKLGLWETCFRSFRSPDDDDLTKYYSGCRWIFAEEYQNIRYFLMPSFFIATQVLYTIGFVFLLVSCIGVLAIQLCFVIDREVFAMKVLSVIMFLAALFSTIAVIIFGIRGDDRDWMPDHDHNFLSWSFGLAVVGVFFEWMSAILFWAESRILYKKEIKREQQMFNLEPTNIKA